MKQTRLERINSEIRKELSGILNNEINDPRVKGLVSITRVEISNDLSHCKVDLSVFSGNKQQDKLTFDTIVSMSGFIRKNLANRVDLRIMPELHFRLDNGFDESEKINKIISNIDIPEEE